MSTVFYHLVVCCSGENDVVFLLGKFAGMMYHFVSVSLSMSIDYLHSYLNHRCRTSYPEISGVHNGKITIYQSHDRVVMSAQLPEGYVSSIR